MVQHLRSFLLKDNWQTDGLTYGSIKEHAPKVSLTVDLLFCGSCDHILERNTGFRIIKVSRLSPESRLYILVLLCILTPVLLNKLMPCPFLISSQSDYLIRVFDRKSYIQWQTLQIQISWLLQKPPDLDLHCLLRQGMLCSAREGLNFFLFCISNFVLSCQFIQIK